MTHPGARLRHPPSNYKVDHYRARLGGGEQAFSSAKAAVNAWAMYGAPWLELHPFISKIKLGATFGILARHLRLYSLSTARIVYVVDTPTRYGFAIGTLPGHLEEGEERFLVELRGDSVWYEPISLVASTASLGVARLPLRAAHAAALRAGFGEGDAKKRILKHGGSSTSQAGTRRRGETHSRCVSLVIWFWMMPGSSSFHPSTKTCASSAAPKETS